eukprot:scaffold2459_cov72-Phaeocystis_antarctica.AAC.10
MLVRSASRVSWAARIVSARMSRIAPTEPRTTPVLAAANSCESGLVPAAPRAPTASAPAISNRLSRLWSASRSEESTAATARAAVSSAFTRSNVARGGRGGERSSAEISATRPSDEGSRSSATAAGTDADASADADARADDSGDISRPHLPIARYRNLPTRRALITPPALWVEAWTERAGPRLREEAIHTMQAARKLEPP